MNNHINCDFSIGDKIYVGNRKRNYGYEKQRDKICYIWGEYQIIAKNQQ